MSEEIRKRREAFLARLSGVAQEEPAASAPPAAFSAPPAVSSAPPAVSSAPPAVSSAPPAVSLAHPASTAPHSSSAETVQFCFNFNIALPKGNESQDTDTVVKQLVQNFFKAVSSTPFDPLTKKLIEVKSITDVPSQPCKQDSPEDSGSLIDLTDDTDLEEQSGAGFMTDDFTDFLNEDRLLRSIRASSDDDSDPDPDNPPEPPQRKRSLSLKVQGEQPSKKVKPVDNLRSFLDSFRHTERSSSATSTPPSAAAVRPRAVSPAATQSRAVWPSARPSRAVSPVATQPRAVSPIAGPSRAVSPVHWQPRAISPIAGPSRAVSPVAAQPRAKSPVAGSSRPVSPQEDPHKCKVCLDRVSDSRLSCKHCFCSRCLLTLKSMKQPCPICRKRFRKWETL